MEYKCVAFDPVIGRQDPVNDVATGLDGIIASEAQGGWDFVGLENHSTVVPGSSGCFGIGRTNPYERTFSVAVFRK